MASEPTGDPMTLAHHSLAASATPESLDEVHALLEEVWIEAPHIGPDQRARFTVVTAELVANVVEHGGIGRESPPWLELDVDVRGDVIHGHLIDDGHEPPRGAPGGRRLTRHPELTDDRPARQLSNDDIDGIRESGRGLLLIRSASDDLALARVGDHNRWHYAVRPRRRH